VCDELKVVDGEQTIDIASMDTIDLHRQIGIKNFFCIHCSGIVKFRNLALIVQLIFQNADFSCK